MEETDGPIGEVASPQVDPGYYILQQLDNPVASGWRGALTTGASVEYWVTQRSYQGGAARAYKGGSLSCADWKKMVCGASFAGATYYLTTSTQSVLNCDSPPGPITPPANAISLLSTGSYETVAAKSTFARTFVTGHVEYWAMDHLIRRTDTSALSPRAPAYTGLSDFTRQLCQRSPPPATWLTSYYTPIANFCASNPC